MYLFPLSIWQFVTSAVEGLLFDFGTIAHLVIVGE